MKTTLTRAPRAKTQFFKSLWRLMLRFDEALNFDMRDDVTHRLAELERQRDVQRGPGRSSSPPR